MAGVEILAIQEVATAFGFDWAAYIIIVLISTVISALMIGFIMYDNLGGWAVLVGSLIGLILSCVVGAVNVRDTKPIAYETQYKVTISDEVSMNDFLEHYEIVSQEGKIYTVRELNDE